MGTFPMVAVCYTYFRGCKYETKTKQTKKFHLSMLTYRRIRIYHTGGIIIRGVITCSSNRTIFSIHTAPIIKIFQNSLKTFKHYGT